jgi:beta-glucanase (GH16 family)
MFYPSAVSVSNNLLNLTATQDAAANPSSAGGNWITGGVCLCGQTGQLYGAYFYRARITGPGPTTVGLLWPDANVWPPEIDFNETGGGTTGTSATTHYSSSNSQIQSTMSIDMTKWHTFGVVWTPTSIIYTVDGRQWGIDTNVSSIPTIPMHLSLQQQTWCASGWACPTSPQSTQVEWVAQYTHN